MDRVGVIVEGRSRAGKQWVSLNGSQYIFVKITSKKNNQFIIKAKSILTNRTILVEIIGDKDFNIQLQ